MERNREERRGFRVTQLLLRGVSDFMERFPRNEMGGNLLYVSIIFYLMCVCPCIVAYA